ncbi:hypothetical protein EW146_g10200 [Bondarzewia mesenterica]|uniref:C2H2-type domain-containing protein n=1 Tax=Bondarzewia mesenterica TaxID=1095465 RepID=A0A4S4KZH9_9AGAM|nr:hypothetical protein EW146_g10200 [Bondarzewia mesenterica]
MLHYEPADRVPASSYQSALPKDLEDLVDSVLNGGPLIMEDFDLSTIDYATMFGHEAPGRDDEALRYSVANTAGFSAHRLHQSFYPDQMNDSGMAFHSAQEPIVYLQTTAYGRCQPSLHRSPYANESTTPSVSAGSPFSAGFTAGSELPSDTATASSSLPSPTQHSEYGSPTCSPPYLSPALSPWPPVASHQWPTAPTPIAQSVHGAGTCWKGEDPARINICGSYEGLPSWAGDQEVGHDAGSSTISHAQQQTEVNDLQSNNFTSEASDRDGPVAGLQSTDFVKESDGGRLTQPPRKARKTKMRSGRPKATTQRWVCFHPACEDKDGRQIDFNRMSDLKRHWRTAKVHVPDPAYECHFLGCSAKLTRLETYKQHVKLHERSVIVQVGRRNGGVMGQKGRVRRAAD